MSVVGCWLSVCLLALALRWRGEIPPFDDAYHLKRIAYSAAHFPRVLEFDPDRGERGAFCPWPPLYDVTSAAIFRVFGGVRWLPPIFFSAFAAVVTAAFGLRRLAALTVGVTIACSPYLIGISRAGHIDHHFVEPALLLAIVAATIRERPILLGVAISIALMVQPALIVAAGVAFVAMFFSAAPQRGAIAFAIAGAAVIAYRLTRLPGYPDSAWFLGYPHAGLLLGAAVACALTKLTSRTTALAGGVATALSFPAVLDGVRFFGGDPWLRSIVEFKPMFSSATQIGTDVANLTGGALLIVLVARRYRTFSLFAFVYLLLALSSRRFLIPAIPLFAIAGALAVAQARRLLAAIALSAATLLPPIVYDVATLRQQPDPSYREFRRLAEELRLMPRGRVLAPWSLGHPIDVIGEKPVIIDNFGSMPDETLFQNAIDAMLVTRADVLLEYCRSRHVRYLVLPHPAYVPAMAATIGVTSPPRRTVWSRLYSGEQIDGFTLVRGGAIRIWRIE